MSNPDILNPDPLETVLVLAGLLSAALIGQLLWLCLSWAGVALARALLRR